MHRSLMLLGCVVRREVCVLALAVIATEAKHKRKKTVQNGEIKGRKRNSRISTGVEI